MKMFSVPQEDGNYQSTKVADCHNGYRNERHQPRFESKMIFHSESPDGPKFPR